MNPTTPPLQFQFNIPFTFNIINVYGRPFAYRPTQSDISVIIQNFQNQEYNFQIANFQPKLIIDLGGNIGTSAIFFANKYPDAQIYAVEPQKDNFRLLQYNTLLYDKIHLIQSAAWDKETFIKVLEEGHNPTDFMTIETTADDPAAMKTVTVGKILAESGFDEIDLLKIDIEGAEKEVFSAPDVDEWLTKVKVLTVELHDRYKSGCSDAFFKAVSKYHWHFELRGENLIFMRE